MNSSVFRNHAQQSGLFNLVKATSLSLLVMGLAACGGSGSAEKSSNNTGETSSNPQPSSVYLVANDVTSTAIVNQTSSVNLRRSVAASDGSAVILDKVTPVSSESHCKVSQTGDLSFSVDLDSAGQCVYEYEISDLNNTVVESGVSRVLAMPADAAMASSVTADSLDNLSASAQSGEQIVIPLSPPMDAELDPSVTVLGSGVVDDVDISANTLTYTAGEQAHEAGVTRLLYFYTASDGTVIPGVVDVAVSEDTFNQAPVANQWTYLDTSQGDTELTQVVLGDTVIVDIANLDIDDTTTGSLVSDLDAEDTLQLIDINAFDASVALVEPENLSNTKFSFSAPVQGIYDVTYQVTDHKGGNASGIIRFYVRKLFKDIALDGDSEGRFFTAPLTEYESTTYDLDVNELYSYDSSEAQAPSNFQQPLLQWHVATSYCQSIGARLPTEAELYALYDQEGSLFESTNSGGWPVGKGYFTSDSNEDGVTVVNLEQGTSSVEEPLTYNGTFTCVVSANSSALSLFIKESGEVLAGQTLPLTGQYSLYGNGLFTIKDPENYNWISSDESVMTVSDSGVLQTALTLGSATVTLQSKTSPDVFTSTLFNINASQKTPLYGTVRNGSSVASVSPIGTNGALQQRCGVIVDAYGTSEGMIGGSGGTFKAAPVANIDTIDIYTADFQFDDDGRVIAKVVYTYEDDSTISCGSTSHRYLSNVRAEDQVVIPEGYEIDSVTVYAANYLHAFQYTLLVKSQ